MYLHIGNGVVVRETDIIGVFDLENTSLSKATRDFLAQAEREKRVINVTMEMPKAFVVTAQKGQGPPMAANQVHASRPPVSDPGNATVYVYITQVSAGTLRGRLRSSSQGCGGL